ncbi:MAG: hypothetical protein ACKO24_04465 [Leptolyngbyaceae cyanobacterium]
MTKEIQQLLTQLLPPLQLLHDLKLGLGGISGAIQHSGAVTFNVV